MSVEHTAGDVTPIPDALASSSSPAEAAARRVSERTGERQERIACFGEPGGLARADSLERVALRVDRLSRIVAGEPVPRTPAQEPTAGPEAVIDAAVERAAPLLGVTEAVRAATTPIEAAGVVLEAIIGAANFLEVRFLGAGARAARAVGRVILRDAAGREVGYGTGSMVSPRLLLTNRHVLKDAAVASRSSIEFDFEDGLDDRPLLPVTFPLDPDAFFLNDAVLDFALVAVRASAAELRRFGFNPLLSVGGRWTSGDFVSIIQHPGARAKQVALRENRVVDSVDAFVHYATDTEPGSSGSPVFNDDWEVVALHHASVPVPPSGEFGSVINEGIRVGPIIEFARAHVAPAQQALLAGLVLAERVVVDGPSGSIALSDSSDAHVQTADADAPDDDAAVAEAPPVGPPAPAHTVRVSIPLELTLSVGTPFVAAPSALGAAAVSGEAITIDPDYRQRRGYDPRFLGDGARRVPLPSLPPDLLAKAARVAGVTGASAHVLPYHHFSVVINRERRLAFFTAVNIDGRRSIRLKRETDRWILDPRLDASLQTGQAVYANNPLDRGHLVRRLDPAWGVSAADAKLANDDTFHFTNCAPQHEDFNQNATTWAGLEDYILDHADNDDFRVSVFSGPVFAADDEEYRGVRLPRQFWKVAVMVGAEGRLSATAYLLSQASLIDGLETVETFSYGAYRTFQVRVALIESLTGLSFGALAGTDPLHGLEVAGAAAVHEIQRPGDLVL